VTDDFEYRVLRSRKRFEGGIFSVYSDEVAMPGGGTAVRDITHHHGAVAVVALDQRSRVVLIRQYRHAVGTYLWEIPAGLCDVTGESGVDTAARELAEEVDLVASRWHLLLDLYSSPGFSDELIRVYLARGLTRIPAPGRHDRGEEEADLTVAWVDLDEAVAMVQRGEITNAISVSGLLAAARARGERWRPLRPAAASIVDVTPAVGAPVRPVAGRRR
jgi:8-oxo-dGDP phosphatase